MRDGTVGDDGDDDELRSPETVTAAYSGVSDLLGDFVRTIEHGPEVLPGSVLTDPRWLARRVENTGRRWNHGDPRVNGTLWWYSASSTLVSSFTAWAPVSFITRTQFS